MKQQSQFAQPGKTVSRYHLLLLMRPRGISHLDAVSLSFLQDLDATAALISWNCKGSMGFHSQKCRELSSLQIQADDSYQELKRGCYVRLKNLSIALDILMGLIAEGCSTVKITCWYMKFDGDISDLTVSGVQWRIRPSCNARHLLSSSCQSDVHCASLLAT